MPNVEKRNGNKKKEGVSYPLDYRRRSKAVTLGRAIPNYLFSNHISYENTQKAAHPKINLSKKVRVLFDDLYGFN